MELEVQPLLLLRARRTPHCLMHRLEPAQTLVIKPCDRTRSRKASDGAEELVMVGDVLSLHPFDIGAPPRQGADEPLLVEGDERLADR